MSALIHGRVAALLVELEQATSEIIDKHFSADVGGEDVLRHYGPFRVEVHGADGHLASFMEEGIDIYPKADA